MMYSLFYLGRFYLRAKPPKLMQDLRTFVRAFRQPIPKVEKKTEVIERKPFSKEEKELLGELSKVRYNFPVFEKLEGFFHQASLKNFFREFRSSGKTDEIIEEDLGKEEEEIGEEEKEILKSIRKEVNSASEK